MIGKAVEVEWKTQRGKTFSHVRLVRRFVTPTNADLFSYRSSDAGGIVTGVTGRVICSYTLRVERTRPSLAIAHTRSCFIAVILRLLEYGRAALERGAESEARGGTREDTDS